jgi:hypothetical protein
VSGKKISWDLGDNKKAQLNTKTGVALEITSEGPTDNLMNEYFDGDLTAKILEGDDDVPPGAEFTCLYF